MEQQIIQLDLSAIFTSDLSAIFTSDLTVIFRPVMMYRRIS
jgi:hypothetical protein